MKMRVFATVATTVACIVMLGLLLQFFPPIAGLGQLMMVYGGLAMAGCWVVVAFRPRQLATGLMIVGGALALYGEATLGSNHVMAAFVFINLGGILMTIGIVYRYRSRQSPPS